MTEKQIFCKVGQNRIIGHLNKIETLRFAHCFRLVKKEPQRKTSPILKNFSWYFSFACLKQ